MAAAGAAIMALPFAAERIAKLAGGSPTEKAADLGRKAKDKMRRGMRFTKRAVRSDLHRFKAYVEMEEHSDKGWRGDRYSATCSSSAWIWSWP
jgi:hypothetical protein